MRGLRWTWWAMWCGLVAVCGGCGASHEPGLAAPAEGAGAAAVSIPQQGGAGFCGADPGEALAVSMRGPDVHFYRADHSEPRVHHFDVPGDSVDHWRPAIELAGARVLASYVAGSRYLGQGAHARALLSFDGEVLWARDVREDGPLATLFGPSGHVIGQGPDGAMWLIEPESGVELRLPEHFGPASPVHHGWAIGRLYSPDESEPPLVFYEVASADMRRLRGAPITTPGWGPLVIDGRVIYLERGAGGYELVLEGPEARIAHTLPGLTDDRPSYVHGEAHTLVLDGQRPLALLDRRAGGLMVLDVDPPSSSSVSWSAHGGQFIAHSPEVLYVLDGPTATTSERAIEPLPETLEPFAPVCAPGGTVAIWPSGDRVFAALRPAAETAPARLYEEQLGRGWQPVGRPVWRARFLRAYVDHGVLAIVARDAAERYCVESAQPPPDARSEALVGASLQLVGPDGEVFSLDSQRDPPPGDPIVDYQVSRDGGCALVARTGQPAQLVDLSTGQMAELGGLAEEVRLLR